MFPTSVQQFTLSLLQSAVGTDISSIRFTSIGGGSINQSFRVTTNTGEQFFAKVNLVAALPGLFLREKEGLALLAQQSVIRTPVVIGQGEAGVYQVLVLEWIREGRKSPAFWRYFGEQLALLHSMTIPAVTDEAVISPKQFGLATDNYMGSLPQWNSPMSDWPQFFIERRLQPQLQLAIDRHMIDKRLIRRFERLYQRLPDVFGAIAGPVLVHGDLWSGNFLCDDKERPVLIDPAVYYGHPYIDLAMTTLFGGFEPDFYDRYREIAPFAINFREQWAIANLYPLLIHLNLFGKGYLPDILHTIDRY